MAPHQLLSAFSYRYLGWGLLIIAIFSHGPPPAVAAETITNSIGMKLVAIPAGEFQMGGRGGS